MESRTTEDEARKKSSLKLSVNKIREDCVRAVEDRLWSLVERLGCVEVEVALIKCSGLEATSHSLASLPSLSLLDDSTESKSNLYMRLTSA